MVIIFHDFIHKSVEFYVNDIIAKFKEMDDCLNLKLNPKNYLFGVSNGKLLGYTFLKRGIKLDPKKIKAIMDMPPPNHSKQLINFKGKLESFKRFMA